MKMHLEALLSNLVLPESNVWAKAKQPKVMRLEKSGLEPKTSSKGVILWSKKKDGKQLII